LENFELTFEKKEKIYTDSAISDLIKDFIHRHKDSDGNYKYVDLIDECTTRDFVLFQSQDFIESNLDSGHDIYDVLMSKPTFFLKGLKRAVKEIFGERYNQKNIEVGIDQVPTKPSLVEALGNQFLGKIITITGMAVSKSELYNVPLKIKFLCPDNHSTTISGIEGSEIKEPVVCREKSCTHRIFEPIIEPDDFERHRTIFIKSDDDFSFQSDELAIDLAGHLTESVEAGDRIQITGIIKPIKFKKIYHNILKSVWTKKLDDVDYTVSSDDEETFRKIVDEPDFHSRLVNSIAPSILGYETIKESLLLQRIGATNRKYPDGTMDRGWFNIGLWGDGGVAKSRFGEWEETNLPKTQMVGSMGATDKGLLLGIEEDASGKKSVRAGAFVRCRDGGVVVLDEFPRLNSEVIDGLMTTLQNGIASISKAGHQARVRADSGLLATGNAYNEEWDQSANLKVNLNMSTPLLQRFDYHWIIIDNPNENKDRKIAQAKLYGNKYDDSKEPYSSNFLAKYCKFVRRFNPELSDEVSKHLEDKYVEIRKDPESKTNGISPRHLETMVRTTLAYARMYQREYATLEDADKALELLKINLSQRNISVSEADTYLNRQYKRCIEILREQGISGLRVEELFDELKTFGSSEEIAITLNDLGRINNMRDNKKWREVIAKIRRSPLISIISKKPLVIAYKKDEGRISSWS
jgi:replicative DNA helicase Mcm